MKLFDYYLKALKNYAVIEGRATRAEYWYFLLVNFLLVFVALCGDIYILGVEPRELTDGQRLLVDPTKLRISLGYSLLTLIPHFAVMVRRLHDIDFRGWWIFIYFLPFGLLILFVFFMIPGTKGDNRFGPALTDGFGSSRGATNQRKRTPRRGRDESSDTDIDKLDA